MKTTSQAASSSNDFTAVHRDQLPTELQRLWLLEAEQLRVYAEVEGALDLVLSLLARLRAQPVASDRALAHAAVVMSRAVDLYAALPGMPELEPVLIDRMKEMTMAATTMKAA